MPITFGLGSGQGPGAPGTLSVPGLGDVGPGQSLSQGSSQSSSGSYFENPGLVNALSGAVANPMQQAGGTLMNFLQNPTGHPLFTNALSGLMQALVPSENNARMNLSDMFRAAGNTASSTFGQKAMGLESQLLQNRQALASNLLTQLFPQITNPLTTLTGQASPLIDALKQQSSQSTSNQQSAAVQQAPQQGQGFGGSGRPNPINYRGSTFGSVNA